MRTFLPLGPIVAILLLTSCSVTSRIYGNGGSGGTGTTTGTGATSSSSTSSTAGTGATGTTGPSGTGGMGGSASSTSGPSGTGGATSTGSVGSGSNVTSSSSSSGCVAKSCAEVGAQCGTASDGCPGGTVDCGFCADAEVCGTSVANVCGVSAACTSYGSDVCNIYNSCAPDVVTYLYGSVAACANRYALLCSMLVSEPQTTWTEAKAQSCGTALAQSSCENFLLSPFNGGPPICQPDPGPRADGADCIDSGQCASAYCRHVATSWCGTCAARGGAGATCAAFPDCQAGFACVGGACVTALATGQACTTGGTQCALGLYCQAGTCQPALELNAVCSGAGAQCNVLEGLYCNVAVNKCLRAAGYAAAGQACGVVMGDMLEGCTAAAICSGTTCTAPAADGAACDPTNHVGCTNPAACINGICTLGGPSVCL
jgi:hypothetical protein